MSKVNVLAIAATAVITAGATFFVTPYIGGSTGSKAAEMRAKMLALEDSIAGLEAERLNALQRNAALEAQNNEQRIAADEIFVQRNAARREFERLQADMDEIKAELERADQIIGDVTEYEELSRLVAPTEGNDALHITTILEKRGDLRMVQKETGTVTYMFRRGQQTLRLNDLDFEGREALASCMETGTCLPMTEHPLVRHSQGHSNGKGGHVEQTTQLLQMVDWDARLVFFNYTHDTGAPIQVYTFDQMANGEALHGEADALRRYHLQQQQEDNTDN